MSFSKSLLISMKCEISIQRVSTPSNSADTECSGAGLRENLGRSLTLCCLSLAKTDGASKAKVDMQT